MCKINGTDENNAFNKINIKLIFTILDDKILMHYGSPSLVELSRAKQVRQSMAVVLRVMVT